MFETSVRDKDQVCPVPVGIPEKMTIGSLTGGLARGVPEKSDQLRDVGAIVPMPVLLVIRDRCASADRVPSLFPRRGPYQ